jgi:DNA-binding MurR/RpiR family transcriptional regulator
MAESSEALPQRVLDAYDEMPRGERRLADVLLEQPTAMLDHSATQLAAKARVSKATAARFFRHLGYASFKAAQAEARAASARPASQLGPRLTGSLMAHEVDLGRHLTGEVQNLVRTIEQQHSNELNSAIRALARGEKLWVVGFGDNYALAHFARALLIRVRPDIRMIPIGGFPVPEEFASISAADTMLACGVERRTRSLRSIMRSAIGAGALVVFVTDQVGRASADHASVTLRCRTRGAGVFDSMTAAVSLLTYLCSALATRLGEGALDRLKLIDSIHEEWGDLIAAEL